MLCIRTGTETLSEIVFKYVAVSGKCDFSNKFVLRDILGGIYAKIHPSLVKIEFGFPSLEIGFY